MENLKYKLELPWTMFFDLEKQSMKTLNGCRYFLQEAGYSIESLEIVATDNFFYDLEDLVHFQLSRVCSIATPSKS